MCVTHGLFSAPGIMQSICSMVHMQVKTANPFKPVPVEFKHEGVSYKGTAKPISSACKHTICMEHSVELMNVRLGNIKCTGNGWQMDSDVSQALVNAIGNYLSSWYEIKS